MLPVFLLQTQQANNVGLTSMRRENVASTLVCDVSTTSFNVVCSLGTVMCSLGTHKTHELCHTDVDATL